MIKKKEKKIVLRINLDFYPLECFFQSLDDFNDLLKLREVKEGNGNVIVVELLATSKNVDLEKLGYEFMNDMLAKIQERI